MSENRKHSQSSNEQETVRYFGRTSDRWSKEDLFSRKADGGVGMVLGKNQVNGVGDKSAVITKLPPTDSC